MATKPRGYQLLKQTLVLLTQEPATSYDLARRLGVKPAQLAQRLAYWRRYGWIEVVSHTRTYYRGLTPVYAVPDPQTAVEIERLYGDAESPKGMPARERWCTDDDAEWMRAQQARNQQKQQMRSRV